MRKCLWKIDCLTGKLFLICCMFFCCLSAACSAGIPGGDREPGKEGREGVVVTGGQQEAGKGGSLKEQSTGSPGGSGEETVDGVDCQEITGIGDAVGFWQEDAAVLLENYGEKGIESDPVRTKNGETYCNILLNKEGNIEYYTVGNWQDTGGPMIWKYTLGSDGASWGREAVVWTEGLKGKVQANRITVILGEDGNYYAYYCDEGQLYHLVRQEGDSCEEIVIPDWDRTPERNYFIQPGQLAVLANGRIAVTDQIWRGYIFSSDGSETLDCFQCGWCETMYAKGNEIFVQGYKSTSILHYDAEKLEFLPEMEGNFDSLVRLFVSGDWVYACCPEGIYLAQKDGTAFRKIMDSEKFYFSKKKGNPQRLFVLGDVFYVVYGENGGMIKKYAPKDQDEVFSGELTVYSLETNEMLIDMIAEFRMQHPEINVRYETGDNARGSTTDSDHIRALNTRILAGDGPDILVLDGLPAESYIGKGILADLSPALLKVKDELQPNIVSNYMMGDHIYMLPLRFMIPMICTSGQNVEIFGSLETLVDYCESQGGNTAVSEGMPYSYILELLYYNFPPDIVSGNGNINKENIVRFLELAERFCTVEHAVPDIEQANYREEYGWAGYFSGRPPSISYLSGRQKLIFVNMTGIYGLGTYPQEVDLWGGALLGNKGIFFPNGVLGINENSANKQLANLFIETMFSYPLQKIYSSGAGFALHSRVLEENAREDRSFETYSSGRMQLRYFNAKDAKRMVQIAKVVQTPVVRNQPVFQVISEVGCAYLKGETSINDAAEEIAERLQMYYLE